PVPAKVLAQHTLSIYELIATRPPGWLATLAFSGVHGFAVLSTVVLLAILVVGQVGGPNAWRAARSAMNRTISVPKHALSVADIAAQRGPPAQTGQAPQSTIVGTFPGTQKAKDAF